MVDARSGRVRALHGHARQHGRERRPAVHPARARRRHLASRMGRERLRADVRGADADRRQARRPLRSPAHLPLGPRPLHARLAALRPRRELGRAHRLASAAGCRRRDDDAGHPRDHHACVPAPPARARDRRLGRRLRARARDRPGHRGAAGPARGLELDLLRQRARGRLRLRRGPHRDRGVPRHLAGAEPRRSRDC